MRDASFDRKTERESRAIAERFAPQAGDGAAAPLELSADPALPSLADAPSVYKRPPHSILRRPPRDQAGLRAEPGRAPAGRHAAGRARRFRRAGRGEGYPPRSGRDAVRVRAGTGRQVVPRCCAGRRHRPLDECRVRARGGRGGPQRHRHRAAQYAPRDRVPARAVRIGCLPVDGRHLAAGARQEHQRHACLRRSGAHAASAGGRHHRLGQVGRRQRDDPVAAASAVARPVPLPDDRSQDAGAVGLQRHSASARPRRHRCAQGGRRAQLGGWRDGGSLSAHGQHLRAQHRRVQQSRPQRAQRAAPASPARWSRCPTSSWWWTSSPTS